MATSRGTSVSRVSIKEGTAQADMRIFGSQAARLQVVSQSVNSDLFIRAYSAEPNEALPSQKRTPPATANEWVARNLPKVRRFSGQWVAVTRSGIVAHSKGFDDVFAKARATGAANPFVFKAPSESQRPKNVSVR